MNQHQIISVRGQLGRTYRIVILDGRTLQGDLSVSNINQIAQQKGYQPIAESDIEELPQFVFDSTTSKLLIPGSKANGLRALIPTDELWKLRKSGLTEVWTTKPEKFDRPAYGDDAIYGLDIENENGSIRSIWQHAKKNFTEKEIGLIFLAQ